MTVKRQLNSLKPALSVTSTPSPNHLKDTSRMVASLPSPYPVVVDSQTLPSGSRSLRMVGSPDIRQRTDLTTSCTCARFMPPPSIQLTLRSLYPIGSTKPFKGRPLDSLPSLMWSRLWTIGGLRLTLCDSEPSMNESSLTKRNSTEPMANSKAPSLPETNAKEGWSVRDFPSGFRIWQESHRVCPQTSECAGDGKRDEDVASKRGCDVIDLTNED